MLADKGTYKNLAELRFSNVKKHCPYITYSVLAKGLLKRKTPKYYVNDKSRYTFPKAPARCPASIKDISSGTDKVKLKSEIYLSGSEIREKFLKFYESKGHVRLPSASLVPSDPTVLLTIAGMLPFKPIFLGEEKRRYSRVTTSQRCVRTNDIGNVGVTSRHHTFFEMLGNFSFGDYFKKEAILWSWEFSTADLKIPESRIWISVYENDDEAFEIWRDVVGVSESKIIKMGADDNFWSAGPIGPCGPCSELYYDLDPDRGYENVDLGDDTRFIEFYNLVFMSLNRIKDDPSMNDENFIPLKSKNIDTGMGLERVARILQDVSNNYETDLVFPIIKRAAELANAGYDSCSELQKRDLKVIGDHIRAIVFMIFDGIIPSNVGRGYVLRRLIRRVVMKGRLLGIEKEFLADLADFTISICQSINSEISERREMITETLSIEEKQFSRTLVSGHKKLAEYIQKIKEASLNGNELVLSGEKAFRLFDTYGFPLEITQEILSIQNIKVDIESFEKCMEAQRKISKESQQDLFENSSIGNILSNYEPTNFLGYEVLSCEARVVALIKQGKEIEIVSEGETVEVILDKSPFYAESGGQIGDKGILKNPSAKSCIKITDVKKKGQNLNVHMATVEKGSICCNEKVVASVNEEFRRRVKCHHTATHLLQSALKKVLGEATCQQGSLVSADRLRFDFNFSRSLSHTELDQIEQYMNQWIFESHPLSTTVMMLEDAKAQGAIAMFGEKYEDRVRVVNVPNVSMELCGGTHVSNTLELGIFKIVSESAIQSGVRRIEAVAGLAAYDYLKSSDKIVKSIKGMLKVDEEKLSERIKSIQQEIVLTQKEVEALKKELGITKAQALINNYSNVGKTGTKVIVEVISDIDTKSLQEASSVLQEKLGDDSAVVLGAVMFDKVSFSVAFGDALVKRGLKASVLVSQIAGICGGKGGGKPKLAQAGGKDIDKFNAAVEFAKDTLQQMLDS